MRPDASNPAGDFEAEWFFVPDNRAGLGFESVFTSSTWDNFAFTETVGERRSTRRWVSGRSPLTQPLSDPPGLCGTAEQWLSGYPAGTPGCEVDPFSGECKCCGPVEVPQAAAVAWGIGDGVRSLPVSYVEGATQAVGIRLPTAASEAYAVSQTAAVIYPDAVGQVEGAGASMVVALADLAGQVEGPASMYGVKFPGSVGEAYGCYSLGSVLIPEAVSAVEGAAAKISVADTLPAAQVEGAGSKDWRNWIGSVSSVSRVADSFRHESYGSVSEAWGPAIPKPAAPTVEVGQVEGVTQAVIPTARNPAGELEGAAAIVSATTRTPAAEVIEVLGAAIRPAGGVAGQVEAIGAAIGFKDTRGAGQVEQPTASANVRWPLQVRQVEGARQGFRYNPAAKIGIVTGPAAAWRAVLVGRAGAVEGAAGQLWQDAKQAAGAAWVVRPIVRIMAGQVASAASGCTAVVIHPGPA